MFLGYSFFNSYQNGITLGEMLDNAKIVQLDDMNDSDHYCTQIAAGYNLVGDPSLKVGGYP